jgi:hypothetical protein
VDNQSFIDFSSVKLMLERKMVLRDPRNSDGAERFTMSECLVQSTYSGVWAGCSQNTGVRRGRQAVGDIRCSGATLCKR